jgi:hypothetical protein
MNSPYTYSERTWLDAKSNASGIMSRVEGSSFFEKSVLGTNHLNQGFMDLDDEFRLDAIPTRNSLK